MTSIHTRITRRTAVILLFSFCASPAFSRGDGGDGGSATRTTEISLARLFNLSRREVKELAIRQKTIIAGFSWGMSAVILEGLDFDRAGMRKMLREMGAVQGTKRRVKRLDIEIDRVDRNIRLHESELKRLERKGEGSNSQINQESQWLYNAKRYRSVLLRWKRHPDEGLK
jgi:hypothetical protein